uniref:TOG domain-containing protein n=1 Tax=Steinernema glaseri TaxID=37863 RepID=A0A1I7Y9J1_9BILA
MYLLNYIAFKRMAVARKLSKKRKVQYEKIDNVKDTLDAFVKEVIFSKVRPSESNLDKYNGLCYSLELDLWQKELLPQIKKGMLRSPEVAIFGIERLLEVCPIDLDSLEADLQKMFLPSISSSNEGLRDASLRCSVLLVRKLKSPAALYSTVYSVIKVLGTKLPAVEHKFAIIAAAAEMSVCSKLLDQSKLQDICDAIIKAAAAESQDAVAAQLYDILEHWISNVASPWSGFQSMFTNIIKSSHSQARLAALRIISVFCADHECTFLSNAAIISSIESAYKKAGDSIQNIAELWPLALLYWKAKISGSADYNLITLNDNFKKGRLVSASSSKDAIVMVKLASKLLSHCVSQQEVPELVSYFFFVAFCWPDYHVRKMAEDTIKSAVLENKFQFLSGFFAYGYKVLNESGLDQIMEKVYLNGTTPNEKPQQFMIPGRMFRSLAVFLFNLADLHSLSVEQCRTLLMSALPLCSLPRFVECDGSLWIRTLDRLRCGSEAFFSDETFCRDLVEKVFATKQLDVKVNMIRLLIAEGDTSFFMNGLIWQRINELVSTIDISEYYDIPENDHFIFNTPDGVLFNTAVIDKSSEENINAKNIRRENKVYSFKEQQEEIQLRKEIAEKKRAEGKLTKQQEKAIEDELKKESEIRHKLGSLKQFVREKLFVLSAAVHSNPSGSLRYFNLMYGVVNGLLKSQLVSEYAVECVLAFRDAVFEPSEDYLHEIVAHATLRELNSSSLYPNWCEEALEDQIGRTFSLLSTLCLDDGCDEDFELDADYFRDTMSVGKLLFVLPLLKSIIHSVKWPIPLKSLAVNFIKDAVRTSFIKKEDINILPLVDFAELLLLLVGRHEFVHIFDTCTESLGNMAEMVEVSGDFQCKVGFYKVLIQFLPDAESDERRIVVLKTLSNLYSTLGSLLAREQCPDFVHRIFVAKFDSVVEVKALAGNIFNDLNIRIKSEMCDCLLDDERFKKVNLVAELCDCLLADVKFQKINLVAVPEALKALISEHPGEMNSTLGKLKVMYEEAKKPSGGEVDQFGRITVAPKDQSPLRLGYASCFLALAHVVQREDSLHFLSLIVPDGLNDQDSECRAAMIHSASRVINRFGEVNMNEFLPFLEKEFDALKEEAEYDILREGLVVLLGTLAKDLDEGNPKMNQIFARLIETLSTPSQQVQESVARCIAPLVRLMQEQAKELLQHLTKLLLSNSSYGERRGAAYGIAGIVKGLGLYQMKDLELMDTIKSALEDKKSAKTREGGLLALEMLSRALGNLFEPYILRVVTNLLIAFGDSNDSVRKSADDASRAMMSILSVYGVKLLMPAILIALEEDSWRTKCASVNLLGSMAFCAPQQLSSCLPSIVPQLIEVLADSHIKVRASGERALKQIAQVIRNPEILAVSSHLLGGLVDPAEKTSLCLEIIVNTKFIHYIDSPSLALIMPIIRRAFSDRSTETRRMAAQIIANIYSLTEHNDMEPYLGELIPGLKISLMDPVPEVRAVSAKALGAIVGCSSKERSDSLCKEIMPWLKENLVSSTSTVDRSGAAQGLAEVLAGLGDEHLTAVMPDIIRTTESKDVDPHVRDGYILMYIYLPIVFGDRFIPYLSEIVPSVLKALADENEYVRHSALKAGQRLIQTYVHQAKKLLLPELQRALFDNNWRIRHAAVTLIGDFLFNISGVSGKMTTDTAGDDDTMGMESASKVIARTLGPQMRDEILAGLYLARSDIATVVRQAASHVWKVVVTNTPRTVKEIMKPLFEGLLSSLSSKSEDRQQMAARCLEELVRKMGERLIIDVLPVLRKALESADDDTRVGASACLREIISNVPRETVQAHDKQLIPIFEITLSDSNELVRKSAARTFNSFYHSVGPSSLDVVITPLYNLYVTQKDSNALDSLSVLMTLNGRRILPFLLPKLTKAPVDITCLCKLAGAAAESLTHHLTNILKAVIDNFPCISNEDLSHCSPLVKAVSDEEDVPILVSYLIEQGKNCVSATRLLHLFLEKTEVDTEPFAENIVSNLFLLYNSGNPEAVVAAIEAQLEYNKKLNGTNIEHVAIVHAAIKDLSSAHKNNSGIPGFESAAGLKTVLPFLREGILTGAVDVKELAADAMGDVVKLSCEAALRPHVIATTGPLIRILGDRFPATVKISILRILSNLLMQTGQVMRPFIPQLQSTILKAMQDPNSEHVRKAAGDAIGCLLNIHMKPDAVVLEMTKFASAVEDDQIRDDTLGALAVIVPCHGSKLAQTTVEQAKNALEKYGY